MRKAFFVLAILVGAASAHSTAQHQLVPVSQLRGEPALELELRKLDTVGNFMMTTAHPDDENNAMLAYFSHGKGYRTSLVTATHGEGGPNEIGPGRYVPPAAASTTRPRRGARSKRFARRRIRRSTPNRSRKACARGRRRSSITRRASDLAGPAAARASAACPARKRQPTRFSRAVRNSIRCLAAPTTKSRLKRAACPSARAWRNQWP